MRILMITRKVDRHDHLAGFIYGWVQALGEQVSTLSVLSWQEGDSSGLADNIQVTHLPTVSNKLVKAWRLIRYVGRNAKDVDAVFCHQMPIYTLLAAPIAKIRGKKVISWYMHKSADWKLRLMEKFTDVVLSASTESFPIPSKKLVTTGHGIDVTYFSPAKQVPHQPLQLLSIGRISPTKDLETMILAVALLEKQGTLANLTIVGAPGLPAQETYLEALKTLVSNKGLGDQVKFAGPVPNNQTLPYLQSADIFLNLSGTGSLDKAVLEAMAAGCLVLSSNSAFRAVLPKELMTVANNRTALADKIIWLGNLAAEEKTELQARLRSEVEKNHNLTNLISRIIEQCRT
jgi:glycosyltransferase involved in cell wall biosynthesis